MHVGRGHSFCERGNYADVDLDVCGSARDCAACWKLLTACTVVGTCSHLAPPKQASGDSCETQSTRRRRWPCCRFKPLTNLWWTSGFIAACYIATRKVNAASCLPAFQEVDVNSTSYSWLELASLFDCEDGTFDVSWSGEVNVSETVRIGSRSKVTIIGAASEEASPASVEGIAAAAIGEGEGFGPIFFVEGGELWLENMAVRKGIANASSSSVTNHTDGGFISGGGVNAFESNVTVVGCEFEDNFAQYWGAGIHANYSRLIVQDTVFRGCRAGATPDAGDDNVDGAGGGIGVEYTDVLIDGSTFEDCFASKKGGGMHQGVGKISILNSTFSRNRAGSDNIESLESIGEGAALSFTVCTSGFDDVGGCAVNDSRFLSNFVARKGGDVVIGSGRAPSLVEINRCFHDNSTTGIEIEDDPQGEGGAFSVGTSTTLVMVDSVVQNAYAGKKGGVFVLSSGDEGEGNGGALRVENSTFRDNVAVLGGGGVISCGEYTTANITSGYFINNSVSENGGVLLAAVGSVVNIEAGIFSGNEASESGGVLWSNGLINVKGGTYSDNVAADSGGVFRVDENSLTVITGGAFTNNVVEADGGVGYVADSGAAVIEGGTFSENLAGNEGGALSVERSADLEISGGVFNGNTADFGGFLYKKGDGDVTCRGASIVNHQGVDGGAIYAVDGAQLDWQCDLIGNAALSGPAVYAREDANVTLKGVKLRDNEVARGSLVFVVSSTFQTFDVVFNDTSQSSDRSAVQVDEESLFVAESSSFQGFVGEAVVYSEGTLRLDSCSFSESSASVLVSSAGNTTIRNTILGDNNYEGLREKASETGEFPSAAELVNVNLSCYQDGPCSANSPCIEGDVGVLCECYIRQSDGEETCVTEPEDVVLTVISEPDVTFHPDLIEGEMVLRVPVASSESTSNEDDSSRDLQGNSTGVVWNITSDMGSDGLDCMLFPSNGILPHGESIIVSVVCSAQATFDGTQTLVFTADVFGTSAEEELDTQALAQSTESNTVSMDVTFFHCLAGNFWNVSSGSSTAANGCELCSDRAEGDTDGLECDDPGASTTTLPLSAGYWRASLTTLTIHECYSSDACAGGSDVKNVEEYCEEGYEGPFCAVCSNGYGPGVANSCHRCTTGFKGIMYFVLALACVSTIVVATLLGIYLVGGPVAVSSTMTQTRASVASLTRRGSGLLSISVSRPASGASNNGRRGRDARRVGSIPCDDFSDKMNSRSQKASKSRLNSANFFRAKHTLHEAGPRRFAKDSKGRSLSSSGAWDSFPQGKNTRIDDPQAQKHRKGCLSGPMSISTEACSDGASGHVVSIAATSSPGSKDSASYSSKALPQRHERIRGAGSRRLRTRNRRRRTGSARRTIAARVGRALARLPLARLKIVIVVWQIISAFADITQVQYPSAYEKFVSIIGIFSLDLGWIFSAACLTSDLDFYDELLIVTIGPMLLLSLLIATYYLGSRSSRVASELGSSGSSSMADTTISTVEAGSSTSGDPDTCRDVSETTRSAARVHRRSSSGTDAHGVDSSQRSVRSVLRAGPGTDSDSEQSRLWALFARHTTMTLIVLYLIYSQVSTVIFQTFACTNLSEIDKSYLRADFRIECDTPKHQAYKIYASFMVCLYPFGIPAAFAYFLARQRHKLNPTTSKEIKEQQGAKAAQKEKMEIRAKDKGIKPTSFLWIAYKPSRYYFEVCECARRLLLTGLLVFFPSDKAGQVAFSCVFAFASLVGFELMRPHVDWLDMQIYRTGCLVIFFTNFLALLIEAEVADPDSAGTTAYSAALIAANIFFAATVCFSAWANSKAMFSRSHFQGHWLGTDVFRENQVKKTLRRFRHQSSIESDDQMEASAVWEREAQLCPPAWRQSITQSTRGVSGASAENVKSITTNEDVEEDRIARADEDTSSRDPFTST